MLTLSGWITTQVPPSSRAAADAKAARTGTAEQAEDPAAGTDAADQHVRLSQAGRELAATMGCRWRRRTRISRRSCGRW
ncbi:hypothetical protein [Pseudomonas aeruginosa]|uniref:hypothetical protein n=1 Tax=Pseudomonas aeruginosa TaxID=287 RepID=UPI0017B54763|nr:hypothetical protein KK229_18285 [Pseudomonas aeruginosa]